MDIKINWVKYLKLSEGRDVPRGTCLFGDYVVVGGNASGRASIVLLDRNTGEVVKIWRSMRDLLLDFFSVETTLYAVVWEQGWESKIYMFEEGLGMIRNTSTRGALSVAYDGEYLYFGGFIENSLYIEKRTLDLKLIKSKVDDRDLTFPGYCDVGVNPATGEVWVVGSYSKSGEDHFFIVIFNRELKEVNRIDYLEVYGLYLKEPLKVCFDNAGNTYLSGVSSIVKLDRYGSVLTREISAHQMLCVDNFLYVFGEKKEGEYRRHVLNLLDNKLNLLDTHILSNVNVDSGFFSKSNISYDGRSIYVAGYDYAFGKDKERWVVYSISPIEGFMRSGVTEIW